MLNSPDGSTAQPSPGLKKIASYWHPYTTTAKRRWLGREILEVVSTEFRDRSVEYYRYALESGVTTINGKVAKPDTVIHDGDLIENMVHRHEPPVTSIPVKVLLRDTEREFIVVDKPGSIPVHPSGRYFKNTLVEILRDDFGYEKVFTVNRLDRLTSGLMIIPTSSKCAARLTDEFVKGTVRKEYIARCRGEFPLGEVVCDAPLLTVDRQMGLNIVHPQGKFAKTIFNRIRYDPKSDTSLITCQPLTGRSHQIRVHLQYLGYPIDNDPVYSDLKIWGPGLGKNGIDVEPCDERSAPVAPAHLQSDSSLSTPSLGLEPWRAKPLPRETGRDIGMGSPVPLSSEAVGIITRLRNMKDESEDWSRWRDVVFRARGHLMTPSVKRSSAPLQKRKKPGRKHPHIGDVRGYDGEASHLYMRVGGEADNPDTPLAGPGPNACLEQPEQHQLTTEEALARLSAMERSEMPSHSSSSNCLYCPECYLPLHPDPKPEKLYIFLHALRYTTSLGTFETELPVWAAEDWVRDW